MCAIAGCGGVSRARRASLITVVHSMVTVAGILNPPETFRVTTTVGGE
ncbi:hypothetical protein [Halorubrum sp. Ea8]|nr:hypothetical protein [Halorubrum sp. Ea8]